MRRQSSADQAQVGRGPGLSKVVMFTASAAQKGSDVLNNKQYHQGHLQDLEEADHGHSSCRQLPRADSCHQPKARSRLDLVLVLCRCWRVLDL